MKWLGVLKVLAHPSLLPLTISTFISIAGPGGVAEISRHAPAIANVPTLEAPIVVAPPSEPVILVLRRVPPQAPVTFQTCRSRLPSTLNSRPPRPHRILRRPDPASTDESADAVPEVTTASPTDASSEPTPPPVDDPSNGGDDTGNGGGNDNGEPSGDGEENPDGSGGDEPVCDPPGTGPGPHGGVPPGHDQNGDGIDDRCQDGAGDDGTGDSSDNDGTGDTGGDTGSDDGAGDGAGGNGGDTGDDSGDAGDCGW